MEKVVGYLGLGNMGHPMAMRIADAGYNLLVFDINNEALIDFRERQILSLIHISEPTRQP